MSLDQTSKQTQKRPWLRAFFRWLAPAAAVLLLAGLARPARAGDEFERAFKYELGRIAAREAVYVLGALARPGYPLPPPQPARVYVTAVPVHHHGHHHGYYHGRGHGHRHGHGHHGPRCRH